MWGRKWRGRRAQLWLCGWKRNWKHKKKYVRIPLLEISMRSLKEDGKCDLWSFTDANKCGQSNFFFSDCPVTFTSQNKGGFPLGAATITPNVLWIMKEGHLWAAAYDPLSLLAMSPLSKWYLSSFWWYKCRGKTRFKDRDKTFIRPAVILI